MSINAINGMNQSQYISMIDSADANGDGILDQNEINNSGLDTSIFTVGMSINDAETAVNGLFSQQSQQQSANKSQVAANGNKQGQQLDLVA